MKHEIPQMLKQGSGAIVNTSSIYGLVGIPTGPAYAAAKHGVIGLTKSAALTYAQKGIRVNALSPGPLDTLAARGIHGFLDMKRGYAERAPLGRNNTHEEVAKAALFLCSDLASGVTGVVLPVDAGYHIMAV